MRHRGPARPIPPPLELLCLKALWSLREGRVQDVRRVVAATRPLAYTTVMTALERLARRSAVTRRKVGRSFLYSPEVSRESLRLLAVRDLLDTYFDGSEAQLIDFLRARSAVDDAPVESAYPIVRDSRLDTALL
jgi:predicted transcriptional regulator